MTSRPIFTASGRRSIISLPDEDGDAGDFALLSQCTSEAFSRVIEKATSKNKNTRYASALKMFAALGNIRKQDQRYRHLTSQHHFIQTMLVLVMAVSIVVVGYGFHSLQLERTQSYNLLVESQMTNRENGQYDAKIRITFRRLL